MTNWFSNKSYHVKLISISFNFNTILNWQSIHYLNIWIGTNRKNNNSIFTQSRILGLK